MTVRSRIKMATLGVAGAALLLSGCASPSSSPSNSGSSPGGSPATKYNVVFIEQNTGNVYFDRIAEGLKKAADSLGFNLSVTGPATAGATDQVPIINDQITKGVNAIIIQASDPASVKASLQKAKAAGIKVFVINQDELSDVREAAVTPLDFGIVPGDQLKLLNELMGGSGDFAILSATTTAPFQKTVVAETQKLVKSDPSYAKLNLVKVAFGDDEPQKSTTETQALLAANPNLKAILSPTTVGLSAVAQTVESAGKGGKLIVTGLGTPDQMRKFTKSGTVAKFQLWNPSEMGVAAGYLVFDTLSGKVTPGPGATFDVPDLGTQTINDKGVVFVAKALTTFDASNIDQFHF